ncbi:YqaJ viral recombinase family protein [Pseudoflavonifractor capillosus]|nr:YqaJ viral recombinase family protein [Pseudoflavonifractor capillosus]
MTNEMWLKCREHGPKGNIEYTVGGSDVATIFGLSPWTTPLELWMVKKGRMKPKSPPNPDQLAMGHMLEPIAAHFYAQRTGNTVTDDNYLYQHATLEYALANIDRRYMRKEDGEGGVLECKSLTYHKAADWADGAIPIYYELQLRYYLAVLDEKHGAFSALWGNNPENDLATPHIERVQAKEDIIFEKLDRWIWSLRHDKPPTMEDVQPQLAMDALARIYGAGKKGLPTIEFPRKYEPQLRKIAALQEENAQLKGAIKKNEEAIEAHSVRIAELMKEHEHGILTTTTDKLLVDFVTSTSRRVSSEYLKQNYPSIYEEARKPSKNRKVKVTIQPL